MGRIRRLFKGTIPLFSALWLGMMLVLLWLNAEGQSARMGAIYAVVPVVSGVPVFRDLEWICGGDKKRR